MSSRTVRSKLPKSAGIYPPTPKDRNLRTFSEVVSDYKKNHAERHMQEWFHHADYPTLRDVVLAAARAQRPDGKRSDHQRRLPKAALASAEKALLKRDFKKCRSFDAVFLLVEEAIRGIHRIGELMVYDTALRIGSYLDLQPTKVYLHSGTHKGAKALVNVRGRQTIEVDELPRAFRSLPPRQIEDCLCIYKTQIADIVRRNGAT